jgi:hypothetical protein
LEIDDDFTLLGMVTGDIIVVANGNLQLDGTCGRNLILEEGSTVFLNGTVSGNVYNRGGELEVYGVIYGRLHKDAGQTIVDSDAVIRGGVINP